MQNAERNPDLFLFSTITDRKARDGRIAEGHDFIRVPGNDVVWKAQRTVTAVNALLLNQRLGVEFSPKSVTEARHGNAPKDLRDKLMDGVVHVDWVGYTYGGSVLHFCKYQKLFDRIRRNGGQINTHALGQCQSMGALVWSLGDRRTVLEESALMWHLPNRNGKDLGKSEDALEEKEDSRADMRAFFLQAAPNFSETWVAEINKMRHTKDELLVTGRELYAAKLAHDVFKDGFDMGDAIATRSGWSFNGKFARSLPASIDFSLSRDYSE